MVKPQELREGNWIICMDPKRRNGEKEYPCQISWRHLRELSLDESQTDFKPIWLADDVLTKCNWTITGNENLFHHPKFNTYLGLKKLDEGYVTVISENNLQIGEPIYYLHQLQNRYYSLVFEEMEVNW